MDKQWWSSVEHYFQAQKFTDKEHQVKILNSHSAKQAAELGRSRKVQIRKDWERIKDQIMFEAVLKKFQTHKELATMLLSTGEEPIVENAPGDYYWGSGKDGTGLNKLGHILEQVCAEITM